MDLQIIPPIVMLYILLGLLNFGLFAFGTAPGNERFNKIGEVSGKFFMGMIFFALLAGTALVGSLLISMIF